MIWVVLIAVVVIGGFFANVLELGWGVAILILIGIAAAIIIPLFKWADNSNKKDQEVLNEKKSKLNDSAWVKANPTLAKNYKLDVQNVPRTAAVQCKLSIGHVHSHGYNEWFSYSYPDSAGGWDVELVLKNTTNKTINYIDITVTPIDRVGGLCHSSIGGKSTTTINVVGPLSAYSKTTKYSRNIWYNIALGSLRRDLITVIFQDGTKQEIYQNGRIINYDKNGKKIDM